MKIENAVSNIQLNHPFKDMLPNVDEFCLNKGGTVIQSINSFCDRVKNLADKYSTTIDPSIFKGYALELLAEYICKTNSTDNRIGIYNYEPVVGDDDNGVDGHGVGENQNPATVQVKFRAGDVVLTANEDGLTNFTSASWKKYGVSIQDNKNMLIITTALKVCERTMENMLYDSVRVLNRESLREMFDTRPEWWTRFYEAIKASRIPEGKKLVPVVFRKHQTDAVTAVISNINNKGKVILPTGCGKTLIEAELIRRTVLEKQKIGVVPIIKVNSSRILLCFQLFEEVMKHLLSHGINAKYANYNSGNQSDRAYIEETRKMGGIYRTIVSTTSPLEINAAYKAAQKENIPLVVFSTYHSSEKFADSGLVPHLTIHDEAHNLVSLEFTKAATLPSEKDYYFTATEKGGPESSGLGMDNPDIFGEMIYSKCPRSMIEAGEMVMPKIHVIRAKKGQHVDLAKLERDYEALAKSIIIAFREHETVVKHCSANPDQIGAKVLVVCRGQKDLKEFFESTKIAQFRQDNPDIHLYAMSSDYGLYNDDEYFKSPVTNIRKFNFLKKVKALPPEEKAIIFHVDMIGEGIDVPGLTGVMPFRNCELSKFYQNVGRAARLNTVDRVKMYDGKISPSDRSTWIKPFSWIIIPAFLEHTDGYANRFRDMINQLRDEYGFIPQQDTLIDNVDGMDLDAIIDPVNGKIKNRPHAKSGLTDFEHEFEAMSLTEKILFHDEVQQAYEKAAAEFDDILGGNI